jgi:hypothetical protein
VQPRGVTGQTISDVPVTLSRFDRHVQPRCETWHNVATTWNNVATTRQSMTTRKLKIYVSTTWQQRGNSVVQRSKNVARTW